MIMKSFSKQNRNFIDGSMLSLPTAYFIFFNILNELGFNYLFDTIWPTLQVLGDTGVTGMEYKPFNPFRLYLP